jgi:hypothetical protein
MAQLSVGDLFPTWYSDREDGMSTVISISPYTGSYDYTHVLRLSAPRTHRGWMEQPIKLA